MKDKLKSIIVFIFQLILGATFIFSGFVKAVDPYGFAYKIQDYLTAFGFETFHSFALPVAIALIAFEFLLGINMLLGMHVKTTYLFTLLFMGVMTPLTLYLALFDPVKDCGCFGDAVIITNWETFGKNVVLLILTITVFVWRKYVKSPYSDKVQWLTSLSSVLFIVGIAVVGITHLPIFDFRPYKIGTNIHEAMHLPPGAVPDEYKTTYIYEKDGVRHEFTDVSEVPANDSTWTYIDAKIELVKEGDKPAIEDFSIFDPKTGEDISDIILSSPDYSFLLISTRLEDVDINLIDKINDIFDYSKKNGYGFYCLTASSETGIDEWKKLTGAEYDIYSSDETTLKTIIRANPGLMLLKDGTIYDKWHYNDFPTEAKLNKPLDETQFGNIHYPNNTYRVIVVSAAFFVLLLLVFGLDKIILSISKRRKKRKDMKMWRSKNRD